MTVAVIPADGTEPVACFEDMDTALAWGLQQYKGKPFIVRVFTEGKPEYVDLAPQPKTARRPATKAVVQVLNEVNEELRERKAFAH